MRRHIVVSIDGALHAARYRSEHRGLKALFNLPTIEAVRRELQAEKAKGYEVIRSEDCDNFDRTGHCLGHPDCVGIKRVEKAAADKHLADHMHDPKPHPVKVLIIGNGRFYLSDEPADSELMQTFIKEWQAPSGAELPSFPMETAS